MDIQTLTDRIFAPLTLWIENNPQAACAILAGVILLFLGWILFLTVRLDKMQRHQRRLLKGADGASLEAMMQSHIAEMDGLREQLRRNDAAAHSNREKLTQSLQRTGLVRYDAFPDMGGRQSFALALLDLEGNGVVVSGLYSRNDARVYAKAVQKGVSLTQPLSAQEQSAVQNAQGGTPFVAEGSSE